MELSTQERDLIRQWFNCVQDVNPRYLGHADYELAVRIYESLGCRFIISDGGEPRQLVDLKEVK